MAEVRAEIASLKQPVKEPRKYFWGNSERMSAVAAATAGEAYGREREQATSRPDAEVFVDMVAGALADPRIGGRRLRQALSLLVKVYRPSREWGGHVERPHAVLRAVLQWCDAVASMPVPPKDEPVGARPVRMSSPPTATPDELTAIERAAALASGIESGKVAPIDRDKTAKFIVANYNAALREQEEKPR